MALTRKNQYDIAIDGQGFILERDPTKPSISAAQEQVFYLRYNQGDQTYTDLSKYWYWWQTDWSAGFKDVTSSADDQMFYYSTNIDPLNVAGAFQLWNDVTLSGSFSGYGVAQIYQGLYDYYNGSQIPFIGTSPSSSHVRIYGNNSGWSDYSGTNFATSQNAIARLLARAGSLWAGTTGVGATWVLAALKAGGWTDNSPYLNTLLGYNLWSCRALCKINTTFYAAVSSNTKYAIVKTTVFDPGASTDWSIVVQSNDGFRTIVDMIGFQGKIYYLFADGEVRINDPVAGTDATFFQFSGSNFSTSDMCGGRYMVTDGNILIFTVPDNEIWKYDGSTMARIYKRDQTKNTIGPEAVGYLRYGAVLSRSRFYWSNLIYDPTTGNFYNWIKPNGDNPANNFYPLMDVNSGAQDQIYGIDNSLQYEIWYEDPSTFKNAADKNYLVLSNIDKISGVDKLAWLFTVLCKPLISSQKITVEYTLDSIITSSTSWTQLGTLDYSIDGAVSQKDLYFGNSVVYKKIWIRVKMDGGSTSVTPQIFDTVLGYLPWPSRKLQWEAVIKCTNSLQRKDQSTETKTGLWLRNYLFNSWLKKSIVLFEDYNSAASTLVVDNPLSASATTINVAVTDNFPESGRLLIDNEEMFYTGKTKTQFLNVMRGQRGTNAVSHTQNTVVSVEYRVQIHNYTEALVTSNDPNVAEYIVHLELVEV